MRAAFLVFGILAVGCGSAPALSDDSLVLPADSGQLVVVTTPSWEATTGVLRRFERLGNTWALVADPAPVVVGRRGLGWGKGLHPDQLTGPRKQEGDGRAPAGVFLLSRTFGYDASVPTGLPYIQATPDVECVDDAQSRFYNQVLDRSTVEADWTSHEEMRREDDLYRLGIIVAHNDAAEPFEGSYIFLHVWGGADITTVGCTAMPADTMEQIVEWVNQSVRPVLVQLPEAEYERLEAVWDLPPVGPPS